MPKSTLVGSRELKTRLGHYLNRVRKGETILVTDRGEPVAELRPLADAGDAIPAALRKLAAAGEVTLPSLREPRSFRPVRSRGATGSWAVDQDREERG
jgi:prevent-host-death family protein